MSYGQQKKFDPYTDGAKAGKADPYTDGAKSGKFDPYTDGAKQSTQMDLNANQAKPDPYTDGAKTGKFDPYTDGAKAGKPGPVIRTARSHPSNWRPRCRAASGNAYPPHACARQTRAASSPSRAACTYACRGLIRAIPAKRQASLH
ncbi:hypothetical protein ACU4HD_10800 [Cupriavidus basilensis]